MEFDVLIWAVAALFIGFVCGAISIGIADSRGGNLAAAFWLGFLLGPIGILISFLLKDDHVRAERQVQQGKMKQCPRCAEAVLLAAQVCRYCGHEFREASSAELDQ